MSGTASIGKRVKFQAPSAPTAMAATMTSQRFWIEKARMRSIIGQCSWAAPALPISALMTKLFFAA
jgi:hypothetical protein